MFKEIQPIKGIVRWELFGPDGLLKDYREVENLLTQIGNQYMAERATGIATPPAQATGMKLGTGTTAVATTGAGAALVTYTAGSQAAFTGGFPQAAAGTGTARKITWKCSWAAGVATATLAEAVIVNEALADATSLAAATLARVLLSPTIVKSAADTLDLTWEWTIGT